ncbi:MAG: YncE family protein, partial [Chloroflexota bacterium]
GWVVYGPCRLAVIDLHTGAVVRTLAVCAPHDAITGLALEGSGTGPVAYLAIWSEPPPAEGHEDQPPPADGRVLAVDTATGEVAGATPLEGIPGEVVLGASPGRVGRRLYGVVARGGADDDYRQDLTTRYAMAEEWRLVGLNAVTLEPESEQVLFYPPYGLTIAPDGNDAYAFAGAGSARTGRRLMHVDLFRGDSRLLGSVPGPGLSGLVVTDAWIYVPDTAADEVAVLDRRHGRLVRAVPVGRRPLGIAAR